MKFIMLADMFNYTLIILNENILFIYVLLFKYLYFNIIINYLD